ncbi:ABC transporter substrate-binding protein [Alkalicoccus luteus]|uniref:ABC transporter substrate-binding protein n=1 Tax=Alkalicoccus luteus TaxID=1237094 RepID=UPI0040334539
MKIWKMTLTGALSIGLLAACGGGNDDADTNGGGNEGNGNSEADASEVSGEITVWGWNVAAASMELAVEQFQEEYPDVDVVVEDIGTEDLYDRLTVGLASGGSGLPDVTMIETDRLDNYFAEFPDGFVNLSEYGFDEHEGEFPEAKAEAMKDADGNFLAAPWDIGPAGVFYHVPHFEEAGVDPDSIETWDDYIEAGEQIQEATGAQMAPVDISSDDALFRMMMNQLGTYYFDEDGNIDIDSDEAQQALSKIQEMREADLIANVDGWDGTVTATINHQVATVPFGVWYAGTIMDQAPEQEGEWDVFKLPAFEGDDNRDANLGGSDLSILSHTENPDAAYAFVEYFTTDVDAQMVALEEYGLFPSLTAAYDEPFFEEEDEFFNNSPIWSTFAEVAEGTLPANYTSDYARALRYSADAQAEALLSGGEVQDALDEAAGRIENETGRERAN